METLEKGRSSGIHGFRYHVKSVGGRVDHRGPGHSNFGLNIAMAAADFEPGWTGRHGNLARGCAVIGVDQADSPELDAGFRIGVESKQAVVFRGDEDDVVLHTADGQICNP